MNLLTYLNVTKPCPVLIAGVLYLNLNIADVKVRIQIIAAIVCGKAGSLCAFFVEFTMKIQQVNFANQYKKSRYICRCEVQNLAVGGWVADRCVLYAQSVPRRYRHSVC